MSPKAFKVLCAAIGGSAVLSIAVFSSYMLWEKAPEPEAEPSPVVASPIAENPRPTEDSGIAFETDRQDGVYTLLLVGNDDGNGNTDTIIVGRMDTNAKKADFISIPRDTLINENWNIRKINSVYWSDKNEGGNGIDALRYQLKRLLGFDIDCYAVIDLGVFVDAIDAMGGVWFDVPQAMDYEDPWQNLYIHLQPGYQHLDGYNAMCLCRYRSDYIEGDLGRIDMQQKFLSACVDQFTELGNIPNISKVIKLLSENLDTNMSSANIAFFLRQALKFDRENISFRTAPTRADTIHGYSYALLELWPWMEMINEYLNPYKSEVTADNLDIVYKDGSSYYCTSYLKGSDYYYPPAPVSRPEPEPVYEPEVIYEPEPKPVLPPPIKENILPSPPPVMEMEIPGSIGNIIIDY